MEWKSHLEQAAVSGAWPAPFRGLETTEKELLRLYGGTPSDFSVTLDPSTPSAARVSLARTHTCPVTGEPHAAANAPCDVVFSIRGDTGEVLVTCKRGCQNKTEPGVWRSKMTVAESTLDALWFKPGNCSEAAMNQMRIWARDLYKNDPVVFRRVAVCRTSQGNSDFAQAIHQTPIIDTIRYSSAAGWYTLDSLFNTWTSHEKDQPPMLILLMSFCSQAIFDVAMELAEKDEFPAPPGGFAPTSRKRDRRSRDDVDSDSLDDISVYTASQDKFPIIKMLEAARAGRAATSFAIGCVNRLRDILASYHGRFVETIDANASLVAFADGWLVDMDKLRPGPTCRVQDAVRRITRDDRISTKVGARWEDFDHKIVNKLELAVSTMMDAPHLDAQYVDAAKGITTLSDSWWQTLGSVLHRDHARTGAQIFLYGYGPTGNSGKTSLGELIIKSLGDLCMSCQATHIAQNPTSDTEAFLYKARKAVLLVATESGDTKWNPERVNKLTGGGTMMVRTLFKTPISVPARWALLAFSNNPCQWTGTNGGTQRRQRGYPFRKMAVMPDDMERDLPYPAPADRLLRFLVNAALMDEFTTDPRYLTAAVFLMLNAWRRACISPTGVISHPPLHPLVKKESEQQQRGDPFGSWFDGAYRLTTGASPSLRTTKQEAYQQYCADMDKMREKSRLGRSQFGEALLRITRDDLAMKDGNAAGRWWSMVRADASDFQAHSVERSYEEMGLGEEEPMG